MKVRKNEKIYLINESFWGSIISDSFSLAIMIIAGYISHNHFDGRGLVFYVIMFIWMFAFQSSCVQIITGEELINILKYTDKR